MRSAVHHGRAHGSDLEGCTKPSPLDQAQLIGNAGVPRVEDIVSALAEKV
jgi:hypothetical protein